MIFKYGIEKKTVVTSFNLDSVRAVRAYAPQLRTGLLCSNVTDDTTRPLKELGVEQLCPRADEITADKVTKWHRLGFDVRAWGVKDEVLMKKVFDAGADGMTVNFPDKLTQYIKEKA